MMLSNAWAVDSVCPQSANPKPGAGDRVFNGNIEEFRRMKMMAFSKNVASIKMKMLVKRYLLPFDVSVFGQKVRGPQ